MSLSFHKKLKGKIGKHALKVYTDPSTLYILIKVSWIDKNNLQKSIQIAVSTRMLIQTKSERILEKEIIRWIVSEKKSKEEKQTKPYGHTPILPHKFQHP
jgi:hypothetical protein